MDEVDRLARVLLDYMRLGHPLMKSDIIVGMGALDIRVAEWATELYIDGYGDYLIFAGGHGRLTKSRQRQTEAERFCEVALALGIPQEKIFLDRRGSNTEENVRNVAELVEQEGLKPTSLLIVTKPYIERRVYATFTDLWPDKDTRITITSPPLTFEEQSDEAVSKDLFLNLLVGDVQRIANHHEYGWRTVPDNVRDAYERLKHLGYTKQLMPKTKKAPVR